jgi:uncharacterized protein
MCSKSAPDWEDAPDGSVWVRCYEELNEHLPPERRKRSFAFPLGGTSPSVGALLQALGLPRHEVELVLVNGEPADAARTVRAGDRVSLYPVFESLDVSGLLRLHAEPLRRPCFLVDGRVVRLIWRLRALGLDTHATAGLDERGLAHILESERRVLLTTDRHLALHRGLSRVYRLRARRPREQLVEVVARFDLASSVRPLARCPRCNALREGADADRAPPEGGRCRVCGRRDPGARCVLRLRRYLGEVLREAAARLAAGG